MSTTSAYGWNIPDNTDLVKDGALAIRTLGNAIDTSMNTALGTKKAGMVLLNTTSFSGVTSVSLPASTFTSTYSNYRFVLNVTSVSGDLSLQFRLRAAGSDNSTNNYFMRGIESIFGSNPNLANDGTISTLFGIDSGTNAMLAGDIIAPQESTRTALIANGVGVRTDGNNAAWFVNSWFNATTSFDSASFIASANNMTGVISVYGYNK
jgi:hypothetical protein